MESLGASWCVFHLFQCCFTQDREGEGNEDLPWSGVEGSRMSLLGGWGRRRREGGGCWTKERDKTDCILSEKEEQVMMTGSARQTRRVRVKVSE